MKWIIIVVVLSLFGGDNRKESYLSDRITAYKYIEEIQRFLKGHNYVLRFLDDTVFTRDNAKQMMLKQSGTIHAFSFDRDSSMNGGVIEMFDKCVPGDYPTRFQDPFTYCIFSNLIEKVAATGQAITGESEQPHFGTIFDNTLNAEKIDQRGVYLLLINSRLATFSHQAGKMTLQPILIKSDGADSNYITFGLNHREIDSCIDAEKAIRENFLYTMLEFHYLRFPPNDSLKLKYDYFEKALAYWNDGFEDFLLGHEYAHQLLHHESGKERDSDSYNLDSWYKEKSADSLSQLILDKIILSKANDQYQLGWNKYLLMGGEFLLTTLGIYERSVSIMDNNHEIKPLTDEEIKNILPVFDHGLSYKVRLQRFKALPGELTKTDHPPVEVRLQLLDMVLKPVLEQKLHSRQDFNDVEDLHRSLADSLLYSVTKMYELSIPAIFNAYKHRDQLKEFQ